MPEPEPEPRTVAIDLHKDYALIEGVDTRLEVVLHPCRVPTVKLDGWAQKHLQKADTVVLEATTNAWHVCDLLQPLVARVVVANTHRLKALTADAVRTDQRAVQILARLQVAGLIPEVWVPPPPVRELRALIHHRQRLVSQRTAAQNRLHSWLQRYHLVPPEGAPLAASNRPWWDHLPLAASEKLCAQQDWALLDYLGAHLAQVEAELTRLSASERWRGPVAFLIQLPGVGLLTAMTVLGAIGDITRFPSARHLVGYAGLGTRVHDSGQTHHSGGITKAGRCELRTAVVEATWTAVQTHPFWQEQFATLEARLGKQKAIVALARKLLVVIWHVLTAQVADRHADTEAVARSLLTWASRHRLATSLGLSRPAFVRQELDRLGLGAELTHFLASGRPCRLPPSTLLLDLPQEVLATLAAWPEEPTPVPEC